MKKHAIYLNSFILYLAVIAGCASVPKSSSKLNDTKQDKAIEVTEIEPTQEYNELENTFKDEVKQGEVSITQCERMLKVEVAEKIFFDEGSLKLRESGKAALKKLAEGLKASQDTMIRVVGHTDNMPVKADWQKYFPTNWELSVLRATTVVRVLQEEDGIPSYRLVAVGRGENDAVAPNDTDDGRRLNRRIEIGIVDKALESSLGEIQSQENVLKNATGK